MADKGTLQAYAENAADYAKRFANESPDKHLQAFIESLMLDIGIPRLRLLAGGRMRDSRVEFFTRPRAKQMFDEIMVIVQGVSKIPHKSKQL